MTLRYLEIFLALARTPNMRDAATRLFISQAAVSSALRDFEAELGVPLFDRIGRGIRLNDKGRLLEERLAPLYNQLKNVLSLVSSDTLAGRIRIGASTTLSDFVLPQVLYNFRMQHDQVSIECEAGNTADIVHHVENGLLDVGFVEGEVHNLAVEVTPLAKESLVIVTADKALADSGPHPIEKLLDRHWLLREPGSGTRETFLRKITPLGLRPKIFLEFEHNDPIKLVLRNPGTLSCLSPASSSAKSARGNSSSSTWTTPVSTAPSTASNTATGPSPRSGTPSPKPYRNALRNRNASAPSS